MSFSLVVTSETMYVRKSTLYERLEFSQLQGKPSFSYIISRYLPKENIDSLCRHVVRQDCMEFAEQDDIYYKRTAFLALQWYAKLRVSLYRNWT